MTCHQREITFSHLDPQSPQDNLVCQNSDHLKLTDCEKRFWRFGGEGKEGDASRQETVSGGFVSNPTLTGHVDLGEGKSLL